jgi:hypothetical protein
MTPLTHGLSQTPRLPLCAALFVALGLLTGCNDIAAPVCTTTDFPVPDSLGVAVTVQICR